MGGKPGPVPALDFSAWKAGLVNSWAWSGPDPGLWAVRWPL